PTTIAVASTTPPTPATVTRRAGRAPYRWTAYSASHSSTMRPTLPPSATSATEAAVTTPRTVSGRVRRQTRATPATPRGTPNHQVGASMPDQLTRIRPSASRPSATATSLTAVITSPRRSSAVTARTTGRRRSGRWGMGPSQHETARRGSSEGCTAGPGGSPVRPMRAAPADARLWRMDLLSAELTGTTLVGALVVLALIDSTSFGTLLIPVWLLMSPGRVRVGRMLLYLGSIAGFYALVGLAVLLGADALGETLERLSSTRAFLVGQLVVGAGLLAWSFKIEPIGGRRKTDDAPSAGAVRLGRWRERVLGSETGSGRALALLAVGAGLVEVATMLPYL